MKQLTTVKERVLIADLVALQFQRAYNTGRQVIIPKHESLKGLLDELIFENVVGEPKRSFQEAEAFSENDTTGRYILTECKDVF